MIVAVCVNGIASLMDDSNLDAVKSELNSKYGITDKPKNN